MYNAVTESALVEIMNVKNRNRYKRMPLTCKYRWRGMAKTNFRKQGVRITVSLNKSIKDYADIWREMAAWDRLSDEAMKGF